VGRSDEETEMVRLGCWRTHRIWGGQRRRLMDGKASLCDKTQKVVRSEENIDRWRVSEWKCLRRSRKR
jgi:hypothetical protein